MAKAKPPFYQVAAGATREAIASYIERQAQIVVEWQGFEIDAPQSLRGLAETVRNGNYTF